jgi:predicted AAA+ superfamily ATPase
MLKRALKLPLESNQSIFLFGPRGTGKSYWLRHHLKSAIYLDLLDTDLRFDLEAKPSRLAGYLSKDKDAWIIIDEVQKIPAILDEVHKLIESQKRKFILTGSSARKLKREGINLLAGRALTYKIYPLTAIELGKDFQISKSLQYGHLPKIYDDKKLDAAKYLESYIKTYLKEEVQQEGFTRNLGAFARFLEVASFSQSSTINMNAISRDTSIKANTVANYFELIEDMLVSYRLPAFTKRAKRRLVTHPKFYYFDAGIYYHLRPRSILDSVPESEGASLETLVLQDLLAINEYDALGYQITYWRTVSGTEVDLVLFNQKKLLAIEIKHSSKVHVQELKGLKSFKEDYPMAQLFALYLGEHEQLIDDIKILPAGHFLLNLRRYL